MSAWVCAGTASNTLTSWPTWMIWTSTMGGSQAYGSEISPVASRMGLGWWQAIISGEGLANKSLQQQGNAGCECGACVKDV